MRCVVTMRAACAIVRRFVLQAACMLQRNIYPLSLTDHWRVARGPKLGDDGAAAHQRPVCFCFCALPEYRPQPRAAADTCPPSLPTASVTRQPKEGELEPLQLMIYPEGPLLLW